MSEARIERRALVPSEFVLPSIINLAALIVVLTQFMNLHVGPVSLEGSDAWARPVYFLGQAVFLWGVGWIGAGACLFLRLSKRAVRFVWALYFTALFVFLQADYLVVYLYGIHIQEQFMRLAREPGILEDIGLGAFSIAKGAGAIAVLLLIQLGLFRLSRFLRGRELVLLRRISTWFALLVPAFVFAIWSVRHQVHPSRASSDAVNVPLFVPVARGWHADGLCAWLGVDRVGGSLGVAFDVDSDSEFIERRAYSAFRSGFEMPTNLTVAKPLNILVLGAESWRFDMLDPEIMPRLWSLAHERGFVSKAHYSTGNRTPEGIFGLFSGLSPLYWKVCRDEGLNPPFFSCLKQLGYTNRVFTSSTFAYGEVDQFVFGEGIDFMNVVNTQKHAETTLQWKRRRLEIEDQIIVERFLMDLDGAAADERRLDFLYFYVTHYNYYYPESFEKFKPAMGSDFSAYDFTLRARRDEAFNRYKNSCYYLDHLLGQVFDALTESGRWKNTIVVITGDHGEEFFEAGRFGHSVALNNYQTRVPFVMVFPEPRSIGYSVTSHADVVPTLLAALGVKPALKDLHTGKNLLEYSADQNAALIMNLLGDEFPRQFAVVKDGFKLQFVNGVDRVAVEHRLDSNDRVIGSLPADQEESALRWVMEQKRYFR